MEGLTASRLPIVRWAPPGQFIGVGSPLTIYRVALADFFAREAALHELLTPAERAQAARLVRPRDRQRFQVGRGTLRYLLGQQLGQDPSAVPLQLGRFGKPQLPSSGGTHFNVAHSGDWVLVAMSEREVGIDLEQRLPDFESASVAAHCFSPAQQREISQSSEPQDVFYRLWTQLEARTKAAGGGLSEDKPTSLTDGPASPWAVRSFEVAPGYSGAVAYPAEWKPTTHFCAFDASLIR